jgi:Raf kinase inhibitor-like YbhB/YbcL family protein
MRKLYAGVLAVAVAVAGTAFVRLAAQAAPAKITVTSSAFKEGENIPKDYTGDTGAKNVSPPISWSGAPASTKEYALILDDPDAAQFNQGQPYVHWIVYKIPAATTSLPEGVPAGAMANGALQGLSNFFTGRGRAGAPAAPPNPVYRGPAPPAGSGPHHYTFTVYALDAPLPAAEGLLSKPALLEAMKGHIVGEGKLIGIFQR